MMELEFDLQLLGGGGESTTTSREIPAQTAEEKALQDYLMQYATGEGELSKEMIMRAYDALGQTYTPNWESVIGDYIKRNDDAFDTYQNWSTEKLTDYQNKLDSYNNYYMGKSDNYLDRMTGNVGEYDAEMRQALNDYTNQIQDYENRRNEALRGYEGSNSEYNNAMRSALADYNQGMAGVTSKYNDLVNGVLPSQYAENRQAALNADLKGTMGTSVNNLANRGIINSSVTNKAMNDISQSASDTLAKRYADDLALEASLVGQQGQNYQNVYGTKTSNAGSLLDAANQLYGNRTGTADSLLGAANQLYGNRTGNYENVLGAQRNLYNDSMSNLSNLYNVYANSADKTYNAQSDYANNWYQNNLQANQANLNGMYQAQSASFEPASQYLNYAGDLSNSAQNLFNTLYSGRMGTGSTTTTKSDGGSGMWSAVGGLGAALICFTGETTVTTPYGYKYIKDIQVGDEVLSVRDGKITTKIVTHVQEPHMADIMKVIFSNGTVWHTTQNQRFFDGRHFRYAEDDGGRPALVHGGAPAYVICVEMEGRKELVYDFTVEGHRGENVFFANDVAAEGEGD